MSEAGSEKVTGEGAEALPVVSRRRTATINFAFHCVGLSVVLAHGILLVPLYLTKIPVSVYGAWLATGNVLAWIELVDPGLSTVLQQRVSFLYGSGNRAEMGRAIGTGIALNIPICLMPLLGLPLAAHLGSWVHLEAASSTILAQSFRLGLVGTALSLAAYAFTAINIGLHRAITQGMVFAAAGVAGLIGTLVMLLSGIGLPSLPLGLIIRASILLLGNALPILTWSAKHLSGQVTASMTEARSILGLLSFSFASRLGATLADRADAFLSATLFGPGITAILALSARPYEPVKLLGTRSALSLMPAVAHLSGEGKVEKIRSVVSRLASVTGLATGIAMGCMVGLNSIFVSLWAGPRFFGGQPLNVLIALGAAGYVFSNVLSTVVYALGGIKQTSALALGEGVVRVGLQYLLGRRYGLIGIPAGAFLSSALLGMWAYPSISARLLGTRPSHQLRIWLANWLWVFGAILVGSLVSAILSALHLTWTWPSFMVAAVLLGTTLSVAGVLSSSDLRAYIRSLYLRFRAARSGAVAPP